MKKIITNIVVDLQEGQRISIRVGSDVLDFFAPNASMEQICESCPGDWSYTDVAAAGIIRAAIDMDQHGTIEESMLPVFAVCVEQIHEHLADSFQGNYSGGIYIKSYVDDEGFDEVKINDFYLMALYGELEHREHKNMCISETVLKNSDETIH